MQEKTTELICLESSYMHSFSILDSFGDGMCCIEGNGSCILKVNNVTIVEGGDFGKSENFSFKFQKCAGAFDCDDGDASVTSICMKGAATCVSFPRPCHEYGHRVEINMTTCAFPESAHWVIEGENGIVKYEGGPCELSKRTCMSDACLPDGLYHLENTGADAIGSKLTHDDGGSLINEEYLLPGAVKTLVVGDLSLNPTTRIVPTIAPSNTSVVAH